MEKDKLALLGIISCIEGELQNLRELNEPYFLDKEGGAIII